MEERLGNYIVSERFAGLHKSLSPAEFDQLEQNILEAGRVRDKIKLWGEYVLDGVHRLKIAVKHDLPFEVEQVDITDESDAKRWIAADQLGRRNLTELDVQRTRVELAKNEGTLVAAETTGVSRRTVQREVAVEKAKDGMSTDIRKRIDDGSLIATQKQLKQYGELTDMQKAAVDEKLRRNPSMLFAAALSKDKISLKEESLKAIQETPHLSKMQKRKISTGTVHATDKDVAAFEELPADKKVLVSNTLDLPEVDDLGDAVRSVKNGLNPIPTDDFKKIGKIKEKMNTRVDELRRFGEDLAALNKDGKKLYTEALKGLEEAISAWR